MNLEIAIVFALLLLTFVAMVWERWSVDVVAMTAMGMLVVVGIITPREMLGFFSNDATLTIACMFILSAALEQTGAIDAIGHQFDRLGGTKDWHILLAVLPPVAIVSAFVNNTPVVVVFMPMLISMAARRGIRPSRLLMPLSFAAIFGGSCTLIGTSTNILVSSSAVQHGQPALGMFELSSIGVVLGVVGLVYMLTIGRRLLPDRETLSSILQTTESRQYLTEVVIAHDSPLIGKLITETPLANPRYGRILDITRRGELLDAPLNQVVLQQGDRLRLNTVLSSVLEMQEEHGVRPRAEVDLGLEELSTEKASVVECVVGPNSEWIGRTIKQINFRQRFGILILAVHRQGHNLREKFENMRLNFGDTILMEGSVSAINKLRADRNFLLLTDVRERPFRRRRMWVAIGTMAAVAGLAATSGIPIYALALLGALFVVLTRCLDVEDAYRAINWKIIFLILGTLALGHALETTGGAALVANGLMNSLEGAGDAALLSAIFALASLLTLFLSNNAVAVLLTPIVIQTAGQMQVDPRPLIVAVALGASASFATPVGYQTNALVYGAGGYRFSDFIRVGLPLNVLFWLVASLVIPRLWPLHPV